MFDIKRIKLIATREIQATLGKRSYRAGLIVQILIVALLALSPIAIAKFRGDDDGGPTVNHIVVVDQANANLAVTLPPMLEALANDPDRVFEISESSDESAARDAVEQGDADAALIATRPNEELAFTVITDDGDIQDSLAQMLVATASSIAIQERIDATGLSSSQVQQLFTPPAMETVSADPEANTESDGGAEDVVNFIIAYASTIIIFIFVVMYGQWISQGVVEEKASRIMEIMVNAATPRDLLAGKVIGIMMTALMQFVPLVLTFGIIASLQVQIGKLVGVSKDQLLDINFAWIAWSSMGWFLLYFLLGFLLYGSLYAGVGSMVSRQEEVGTAVAPMTTVMMVGYFAALASMSNPDGTIARIAYLFPGTTVFVAMLRLINGNPYWWEIAISIGGLLIAIVLAMMFAARLYRVGVLMYGQAPSFKSLFNLKGAQQVAR